MLFIFHIKANVKQNENVKNEKKKLNFKSSSQLKAKIISEMNIIARIMREAEGNSEKERK